MTFAVTSSVFESSKLAPRFTPALLALAWLLSIVGMSAASAEEIESSIARGGRLYDKWFKVIDSAPPKTAHASYPARGTYKGKKGADWRCKECHGWDYAGRDGAYAKGKHFTGITGIRAFEDADPGKVVAVLKNGTHGYTDEMLDAKDFEDLALFVSKGQVDMDKYIDRTSKAAKGDAAKGEPIYNTICANCHGFDGMAIKDGLPLGRVANSNPWEALHKIRNGQPGEQMTALRAFDVQLAVDILAYTQGLPKKR